MMIVRTNKRKHDFDMEKIRRLPGKPYNGNCIYSGPTGNEVIDKAMQPEILWKIQEVMTIKKGCRVMCVENLCTPWGICNGTMGTV